VVLANSYHAHLNRLKNISQSHETKTAHLARHSQRLDATLQSSRRKDAQPQWQVTSNFSKSFRYLVTCLSHITYISLILFSYPRCNQTRKERLGIHLSYCSVTGALKNPLREKATGQRQTCIAVSTTRRRRERERI
jgi:hypothetical protein